MKHLVNRVTAAAIAGQFKVVQLRERLEQKVAPTPAARRVMLASSVLTFTALMLVSSSAFAFPDNDGIAGMVNKGADQADSVRIATGKFFMLGGVIGAAYGIGKLIQKGKEGEQSHVKGSHIIVPLLGGVLLGAVGVVMAKVGQSVGLQDSDYGSVPGN